MRMAQEAGRFFKIRCPIDAEYSVGRTPGETLTEAEVEFVGRLFGVMVKAKFEPFHGRVRHSSRMRE